MDGDTSNNPLNRWLWVFPLVLIGVVIVGTAGYCLIEGQTLVDGLYMTLITISTVGFNDIPDMSVMGRWWTMGVIVLGVGSATATFTLAVAVLTGGTLREILGRRQVERAIEKLRGHTLVCGHGRMGRLIVEALQAAGRDVVVIEKSPESFDRPDVVAPIIVTGDAQDEAVLQTAGIEQAASLVACLPDDADNLFLTITTRQLNPALTIIARAEQPTTQAKLLRAGATRVVCPQIIGATRVVNVLLRPAVVDFVEVANKGLELEMDQLVVAPGSQLIDRTLKDLALPARTGAMVVAVKTADGRTLYNPGPDVALGQGDTLIMVGRKECAVAVRKLQDEAPPDPSGTETLQ